jgi:hypothetical protein
VCPAQCQRQVTQSGDGVQSQTGLTQVSTLLVIEWAEWIEPYSLQNI